MNEECLICKAPLTYLEADILMECEICHKKENSKTRCVNGHYVCNECHTRGLDRIISLCMTSASRDPIAIIEQMMALPTCHMHGPEHHVMVGVALLTAYHNAGGDIDLRSALTEMMNRGRSVPGATHLFAALLRCMRLSSLSKNVPQTRYIIHYNQNQTEKQSHFSLIIRAFRAKLQHLVSLIFSVPYIVIILKILAKNFQNPGEYCRIDKALHKRSQ